MSSVGSMLGRPATGNVDRAATAIAAIAAVSARRDYQKEDRLSVRTQLLMWPAYAAYVPAEEAHLERMFGDEYGRYRARAAKWIGRPQRTPHRSDLAPASVAG